MKTDYPTFKTRRTSNQILSVETIYAENDHAIGKRIVTNTNVFLQIYGKVF